MDAGAVLTEAHDLLGLVHANFNACAKKSRRLKKYESATAGFLRELENVDFHSSPDSPHYLNIHFDWL